MPDIVIEFKEVTKTYKLYKMISSGFFRYFLKKYPIKIKKQ